VGEEFNITGYISGEANIASLGYHEFIVTWSYGGQIYTKILGYDGSQLSTIVLDTNTDFALVDENAPIANDDTAVTNEDTAVIIDVLANDTDVNGDTLSVTTASAANGTVVVNADGTLTYTGNPDFNGVDTISYSVSDGVLTDTGSVTVTVNPQNEVIVEEYSVAAGEINPGEPAYDVVKTKTYSDDGSVLLSIHKVETYVTGQVVTSDTVYNPDGSTTFHRIEERDGGSLSKDIVIDVDGNRAITKYELDGTTLKGTIEITASAVSGVEETRVYKDAAGNVTNTTTLTITTGTDQAGNSVDIYTDIVDATGAIRVHEANGETNFWGVDHDTHNHQFYGTGDNKVFITEAVDANGDTSVTYSNKYGYSENVNVNDDPIVNNPIADVVLEEGNNYPSNIDPDALGWFSDADGDQLTYTFHWPMDAPEDVETLEQFNNLNATELAYIGEESVMVIATDPSGATATQTMKFIVEPVISDVITGTTADEIFSATVETTSILAGAGNDTVVFYGNYADYTFSQSDSFVSLMTNNNTEQVVSLFGVEQLQFDDIAVHLSTTGVLSGDNSTTSSIISGIATFDYSNNNGDYSIGEGDYTFVTMHTMTVGLLIVLPLHQVFMMLLI